MRQTHIVLALLLTLTVATPAVAGVRRPVDRESDRGRERHEAMHEQEWSDHASDHEHAWEDHAADHEHERADRDLDWERHAREHAAERDAHARDHARERRRDRVRDERRGPHRKWAEVVHVSPVYDRFRVVEPRQRCRTETITRERGRPRVAGTVFGATAGGALGYGLGHDRRSRRAGTVFGAILGGVLGHEIGDRRARRHRAVEVREIERCRTVDEVSWERRVVGYDVDYRYRGRMYRARMDDHPGRRVRVDVDVRPRVHRF